MDLVNSIDGPPPETRWLACFNGRWKFAITREENRETQKRGTRLPHNLSVRPFYFEECIVSEHIKCTSRLDWVRIIPKANNALRNLARIVIKKSFF